MTPFYLLFCCFGGCEGSSAETDGGGEGVGGEGRNQVPPPVEVWREEGGFEQPVGELTSS